MAIMDLCEILIVKGIYMVMAAADRDVENNENSGNRCHYCNGFDES